MKISTRFAIVGAACAAAALAISIALGISGRQVERGIHKNRAAADIVESVAGLRYLSLEYARQPEARIEVQWASAYRSLGAVLGRAADFDSPEEQESVAQIREAYDNENHSVVLGYCYSARCPVFGQFKERERRVKSARSNVAEATQTETDARELRNRRETERNLAVAAVERRRTEEQDRQTELDLAAQETRDRQTDLDNAQTAARFVAPLGRWRRIEPRRSAMMRAELERVAKAHSLSRDTLEQVTKSLG